jgi:CMP-N-acetylneuraminic acid synthetase
MSVLAVIPARMGSKRMPWKNRMEISPGVSLAQHAVDCAVGAGVFDHIVVSTDDPEHLPIRDAYVSKRPTSLSGDDADISAVVKYEVERAEHARRVQYSHIVTLQPSVLARSPLIVRSLVDAVIDTSSGGGLTMCPVHPWIWQDEGNGAIGAWWLPGRYPRSQECGPRWQEINAVQVAARDALPTRWRHPLVILELPSWAACLDIDTPEDLAEARDIWPFASRKLETWTGNIRRFTA